jgi:hypothetical protein
MYCLRDYRGSAAGLNVEVHDVRRLVEQMIVQRGRLNPELLELR